MSVSRIKEIERKMKLSQKAHSHYPMLTVFRDFEKMQWYFHPARHISRDCKRGPITTHYGVISEALADDQEYIYLTDDQLEAYGAEFGMVIKLCGTPTPWGEMDVDAWLESQGMTFADYCQERENWPDHLTWQQWKDDEALKKNG